MFDLGFIADIRYLLRRLPPPEQRQSMLFSATLSQRVLELAYEHMNNPELVRIEPDKVTIDRVRQVIYFPSMEEKMPLLVGLLRETEAHRTHGVRQHPAHGRAARDRAARQRLQRPGAVRRCAADQAAAVPAPVPRGRAGGADRHRRRLARPAHPGRQPRVQLRPAAGCRPTTCTASAARRAPAPRATPSASAARNTRSRCRTSRPTSATRSRSPRSTASYWLRAKLDPRDPTSRRAPMTRHGRRGAAAVRARRSRRQRSARRSRSGGARDAERPVRPRRIVALEQLRDRVHGRELLLQARRRARCPGRRTAYDQADAGARAPRAAPAGCRRRTGCAPDRTARRFGQLAPELAHAPSGRRSVRAEAGIEVADHLGARILDRERGRMRIGHQHQALAAARARAEELARARQPADAVRIGALERGDVELELAAPVVDAVPVERALAGAKARLQLRPRLLPGSSSARAPRPPAPARARSDCRTPDRAACRPGRAARSRCRAQSARAQSRA